MGIKMSGVYLPKSWPYNHVLGFSGMTQVEAEVTLYGALRFVGAFRGLLLPSHTAAHDATTAILWLLPMCQNTKRCVSQASLQTGFTGSLEILNNKMLPTP